MQRTINLDYCPFRIAREEVRNKFLNFVEVLTHLRNQLFDEIDRFQREWETDMYKFQKLRHENIVVKSLESKLTISPTSKPNVEINWNKSLNLFQLTPVTKIARISWLNQSTEDDCFVNFRRERSVPVHLDIQRSGGHSTSYIDTEATPVSDQNFSFDHGMLKKSMSTDFNLRPNNSYENVRFSSAKNSDQIPSSRASTGNNLYANERELDARGTSCRITNVPAYCSLNVPNIYMGDKLVSRSAPQSPNFGARPGATPYTRNYLIQEPIKFCDPRERDILLSDNPSSRCNSPLQTSVGYTRQQTVIKNPEWSKSLFTESQDGIVNQLVRKFEDQSYESNF